MREQKNFRDRSTTQHTQITSDCDPTTLEYARRGSQERGINQKLVKTEEEERLSRTFNNDCRKRTYL